MPKQQKQKHLLFIDTNIYLDFYRQSRDVAKEAIQLIENNKNKIICSFQVEMEFKKNRQKVIFESFKQFKNPDWGTLTPPSILADSEPATIIEKNKKAISKQHNILKKRLTDLIENPASKDDVYRVLQRLFKSDTSLNLKEGESTKKVILDVLESAKVRFFRGAPPRKTEETSFGDAINWEWMVRCAKSEVSNLIVVTRDQDYGLKFNDKVFANDWLQAEFKLRVNNKKKLIVTERLTEAFKLLNISFSDKAASEEKRIIQENLSVSQVIDNKIPPANSPVIKDSEASGGSQ